MELPKQGWLRLIILPNGEVREICGDEAVMATESKAVDYPSRWQTGTPTEEGWYLLLVDKETPRYTLGRWSGHWEFPNQDFVIAYQKIEPYKPANTKQTENLQSKA